MLFEPSNSSQRSRVFQELLMVFAVVIVNAHEAHGAATVTNLNNLAINLMIR